MSILQNVGAKIGSKFKEIIGRVETLEGNTSAGVLPSTVIRTMSFTAGVWYDLFTEETTDIDTSVTSFLEISFSTYNKGGSIYR